MPKVTRSTRVGKKRKEFVGRDDSEQKLTLATEFSEPVTDMWRYSWFLFGEKKIGKTSLCSQIPDAHFLMFEPGGLALSLKQRPVNNWKEAKEYLKLFQQDDKRQTPKFKAVIIDIVDVAYRMCLEHVCTKLGISHPSDQNDFGGAWSKVRDEFTKWVNGILALDKGVVFISHAKFTEFTRRDGTKYDILAPTLTGQPLDVITGLVDTIMYYGYNGERRQLVIRGDESIDAGTRLNDNFLTKVKGRQIKTIDMGESKEESYQNFENAFNNQLKSVGELPTVRRPVKKKRN